MSADSVKLSKNLGNLGQNVQYFSQMATLFVAFPDIRGILINLLHLHGDFSKNSGNSYQNTYICSQLV